MGRPRKNKDVAAEDTNSPEESVELETESVEAPEVKEEPIEVLGKDGESYPLPINIGLGFKDQVAEDPKVEPELIQASNEVPAPNTDDLKIYRFKEIFEETKEEKDANSFVITSENQNSVCYRHAYVLDEEPTIRVATEFYNLFELRKD